MNILEIITKKKNGEILNYEELYFAFNGYLKKEIPDYQMSALLMAITIKGMNLEETIALTDIFIKSGETYSYSSDCIVDKHSTGGVGDTTTLVIGPICAALGLKMAKMSGRGLGLTGGTIDKVESIPGFNTNLGKERFIKQVEELGFALSSQTPDLVPLDKVIYALRDVTGTTESIPLIASSIMAKKIAAGAQYILIDVKYGRGALMKSIEDAKLLSQFLITIGEKYHRQVKTILSDMNTPLSRAIGNALEVQEAINVLKGERCPLYDTSVEICATLYSMVKKVTYAEAQNQVLEVLNSGAALTKFYAFVAAQDGDISSLPQAAKVIVIPSPKSGTVTKIDALGAAKLAAKLGSTKQTLNDTIDPSVGIVLAVLEGDKVTKDAPLMTIHMPDNIALTKDDLTFIEID